MGFWFRVRVGPVGYTARGRRKPQSFRAYKQSRERRENYAARYEREKSLRGTDLSDSDKLLLLVAIVFGALASPFVLVAYLIRRFLRAIRPSAQASSDLGSNSAAQVEALEDNEELLRATKEIGIDLSQGSLAAPEQQAVAVTPYPGSATSQPPGSTIEGRTSTEFDRVSVPTLRAWLKFWKDVRRSAGRAEEMALEEPETYGGRTREDHIQMIEAEIVARGYGV